MADSKLTGLDQITTAVDNDLVYIVDDPLGTPVSKGITVDNFVDNYITLASKAELDIMVGATLDVTELNYNDGATPGTAVASKTLVLGATKNIDTIDFAKDGLKIATIAVTTTAAELNILDEALISTTELNYLVGVTSAIQTQLDAKAPLASPALTGVPTAPTASPGTATTQIATTAFADALAFQSALPGISPSTEGKVVSNDGSVALWAAGGRLVHLERVSASAAAEVELDSFSANYDEYIMIANFVTSASVAVSLTAKVGGAYLAGTNYSYGAGTVDTSGAFTTGAGASGAAANVLAGANGTTNKNTQLRIYSANDTTALEYSEDSKSSGIARYVGFGYVNKSAALQAIKLAPASGTITGTFDLYGIGVDDAV